LQRGVLVNAKAALEKLGCSGAELEVIHRPTKSCAVQLHCRTPMWAFVGIGIAALRCGGTSAVVHTGEVAGERAAQARAWAVRVARRRRRRVVRRQWSAADPVPSTRRAPAPLPRVARFGTLRCDQ
jgi:hypothetical protein